jgi:hypothetical protein
MFGLLIKGAPMKKTNPGIMNKRLLIALILLTVFCGGTAHAAFDGFLMENSGYILMENSGYILQETSTAPAPTSGINPALLFIILGE